MEILLQNSRNQPLRWYKTTFDMPAGSGPFALNLTSMGKGEAWVNGENIGRYWVSLRAPNGQPSQSLYVENNSYVHLFDYFMCPLANFEYYIILKTSNTLCLSLQSKVKNCPMFFSPFSFL